MIDQFVKEDLMDLYHVKGASLDEVYDYARNSWDLDLNKHRLKQFLGIGKRKTEQVS